MIKRIRNQAMDLLDKAWIEMFLSHGSVKYFINWALIKRFERDSKSCRYILVYVLQCSMLFQSMFVQCFSLNILQNIPLIVSEGRNSRSYGVLGQEWNDVEKTRHWFGYSMNGNVFVIFLVVFSFLGKIFISFSQIRA